MEGRPYLLRKQSEKMEKLARALSVIQQGMLRNNHIHVKDSVNEASEVLSGVLNTHKCLLEIGVEIRKKLEFHPASKNMDISRRGCCRTLHSAGQARPREPVQAVQALRRCADFGGPFNRGGCPSLLGLGRLRVGWVNCRIREHVEIAQCFRCQGYGGHIYINGHNYDREGNEVDKKTLAMIIKKLSIVKM